MHLNQTQPSPLTVLLQLNFCYQVQMTVASPHTHPSSYSSVATTLYPTLVYDDDDDITIFSILQQGLTVRTVVEM